MNRFHRRDGFLGAGNDVLDGGESSDGVDAGAGNGVVLARDHTRDRIDCSAGRDRAYVDGDSSIRPDKLVRCEFIQLG